MPVFSFSSFVKKLFGCIVSMEERYKTCKFIHVMTTCFWSREETNLLLPDPWWPEPMTIMLLPERSVEDRLEEPRLEPQLDILQAAISKEDVLNEELCHNK